MDLKLLLQESPNYSMENEYKVLYILCKSVRVIYIYILFIILYIYISVLACQKNLTKTLTKSYRNISTYGK